MTKDTTVIDRPVTIAPAATEAPLEVPGGATVMLLNDDVTPFEVVIEALMYGTGLPKSECYKKMMKCHNRGWNPVASYGSVDIAQTVADKIMTHARQNTKYDRYRSISKHQGPWPLSAEVLDAQQ